MSSKYTTDNPIVSVIIPSYNALRWIDAAISSALEAAEAPDDPVEVIVVDDGSTDGTSEHIRRNYGHDSRLKLIRIENSGVSVARNVGMQASKGHYITFLDADDRFSPGTIHALTAVANETGADIVQGVSFSGGKPLTPIPDDIIVVSGEEAAIDALYQKNVSLSCCGKLIDRKLIDVQFTPGIRFEDIDYTLRLLLKADKVAIIGAQVYFYRLNSESFLQNWSEARLDSLTVTDKILETVANGSPQLQAAARDRRFAANWNILLVMRRFGVHRPEIVKRSLKTLHSDWPKILFNRRSRTRNRWGALASALHIERLLTALTVKRVNSNQYGHL